MGDRRRERREGDWVFDPALAAINRRLHRELREEAEEVEAIVAEAELRARTLADIAREARNRGDALVVATSRKSFAGTIVYAAGDFITLRNRQFEVDINLGDAAYLRVTARGTGGGRAMEEGPGTFEMRLVERRSRHDRVEVGYRALRETLIGRITTVGQDHVLVLDDHDQEWVLPLSGISYVLRQARAPRRLLPPR